MSSYNDEDVGMVVYYDNTGGLIKVDFPQKNLSISVDQPSFDLEKGTNKEILENVDVIKITMYANLLLRNHDTGELFLIHKPHWCSGFTWLTMKTD